MPDPPQSDEERRRMALALTLENSFYGLDRREILAKIKRRKDTAVQREAISEAAGIREGRVLDLLVELRVTPESLAALSLAPLVLVAWADGRVDAKEREAVLGAACEAGVEEGAPSYELLRHRLADPPDPALVRAWSQYAQILGRTLPSDELAEFKRDLLERARQVAEASRGRLGLGARVSRAEQEMLDALEKAFG